MKVLEPKIRYEAEREPAFAETVRSMPGGEFIDTCIQCGTCSGICPLSLYMDRTPRQIIGLARDGFKKDIFESNTIWLCSSCYACTVECPREIAITDVMYTLKQLAIREGAYPKNLAIPVLAQEFHQMVKQNGRISETRLVLNMVLKTDWKRLFGMSGLGLKLRKAGRFSLKKESIARTQDMERLLERRAEKSK